MQYKIVSNDSARYPRYIHVIDDNLSLDNDSAGIVTNVWVLPMY